MEHFDRNRCYLAKVSRIGIIVATLYALLCGLIHYFTICASIGQISPFRYLFGVGDSLIPETTVVAAGLLALAVCGILSAAERNNPATVEVGWIIGGRITLLSAPVGAVLSLFGTARILEIAVTNYTGFLFSFATLATVFVGYALGKRGISVNQTFLNTDKKTYTRRVLRNTAVVCGVMLVSVLLAIGRTWKNYGEMFGHVPVPTKLTNLVWAPLRASAPVALAVAVVYPLLSIVARLDEAPRKGRFGKGTILLGWVTLGVVVLDHALSVASMVITAGRLTSNLYMEAYEKITELQAMSQVTSPMATVLGIWTLCVLLPSLGRSKPALWGVRGLLGVVVLRKLSMWILDVIGSIYQLKAQSGSGVGIIGGGSMSLTVFTARVQSWLSMIFTVLFVAALVLLTIGLTRHLRVSKAFWAVPTLTAATIAASLLVSVIWELILRIADDPAVVLVSVMSTVIAAILYLIRSLVGILVLSRATTDDVPHMPESSEVVEPPKMLLPKK